MEVMRNIVLANYFSISAQCLPGTISGKSSFSWTLKEKWQKRDKRGKREYKREIFPIFFLVGASRAFSPS